jgi:hypothetical protein
MKPLVIRTGFGYRPAFTGYRVRRLMAAGAATAAITVSALALPTDAFAQSPPISYYPSNAGYAVFSTTTPPTSATAQLQVPTLSCTKTKAGVGFGALVENSDGTVIGDPVVVEQCVKRVAEYLAEIHVNGTVTQLSTTVRPNDLITLSSSQNPSQTSATFTDNTTGFTQTMTGTGATSEFGFVGSVTDKLLAVKKVANFSTFSYTNAKINGADIGTYTPSTGLYEAVQTTKGKAPPKGKIEIQPGTLGASSFPLTWVSAG